MGTVIVYGTNYGTSEKVAQILGEQIAGAVELIDAKDVDKLELESIDKLIIGCGIKMGKIPKNLKYWIDKNQDEICKKDLYLYMCAQEQDEDKVKELFEDNFPREMLEKSKYNTCVGGELDLNKLNFLMRILVTIVRKSRANINNLSEEKIHKIATEINKLEASR